VTTVTEAKSVLSKLAANLVAATNKATALMASRRQVSFKACNGDSHARALLDEMNTSSMVATLELENIRSAIDEARSQLAAAEREEELAAKRVLAEKVKRIVETLEGSGAAIAGALRSLCGELHAFDNAITGLLRLGAPVHNGQLIKLAFTRCILSQLKQTGLVECDAIPPGTRSEPEYLTKLYLDLPRKWAADILNVASDPVDAPVDDSNVVSLVSAEVA
jgi:hypothetical protein